MIITSYDVSSVDGDTTKGFHTAGRAPEHPSAKKIHWQQIRKGNYPTYPAVLLGRICSGKGTNFPGCPVHKT
jgi:hypothetical protein